MSKPAKLNWTPSQQQWTATIRGKFYRLGTVESKAQEQFDFLLHKDNGTVAQGDPNPAFATVAEAWLVWLKDKRTPARWNQCKVVLRSFAEYMLLGTKATAIKPHHVENWIAPQGLAIGTQTTRKAIILACLNWAAKKHSLDGGELIASNPLKGRLKLPQGRCRGGETVWTDKLYQDVLSKASPAFADVVKFLRLTGCRPNVARRVEARHYNRATQTLDCGDCYLAHSKKKTRRVWLNKEAVAIVERLCESNPTGKLFRTDKGTAWTETTMIYTMREMGMGCTLGGLRHTFATDFVVKFPHKLEYLRELLGHADLTMIRKHYGHLFDEHSHLREVLEML